MATIRCYNIKWDTDGEEIDLPGEVVIEIEEEEGIDLETLVNEQGADVLSDEYGWCIFGYNWEEVTK